MLIIRTRRHWEAMGSPPAQQDRQLQISQPAIIDGMAMPSSKLTCGHGVQRNCRPVERIVSHAMGYDWSCQKPVV
jgi:hypothetical protein